MEQSLNDSECHLLAEFFTVFGNPTRLRMFCLLQDGRKSVSQLAEHAGVTLQNASQHLRLMRDKGAVGTTREGQHVYYEVVDQRFVEAAQLIRAALVDSIQRKAGAIESAPRAL